MVRSATTWLPLGLARHFHAEGDLETAYALRDRTKAHLCAKRAPEDGDCLANEVDRARSLDLDGRYEDAARHHAVAARLQPTCAPWCGRRLWPGRSRPTTGWHACERELVFASLLRQAGASNPALASPDIPIRSLKVCEPDAEWVSLLAATLREQALCHSALGYRQPAQAARRQAEKLERVEAVRPATSAPEPDLS